MRVVVVGHVRGQSHPPHCTAHPGRTLCRGARRSLVGHAAPVLGWLAARWSRVCAGCRGPPGCHGRPGAVLRFASFSSGLLGGVGRRAHRHTDAPGRLRGSAGRRAQLPSARARSAKLAGGGGGPSTVASRRLDYCSILAGLAGGRAPPAQRPGCRLWGLAARLAVSRVANTPLSLPRPRALAFLAAVSEGVAPVPSGGSGWCLADSHPG